MAAVFSDTFRAWAVARGRHWRRVRSGTIVKECKWIGLSAQKHSYSFMKHSKAGIADTPKPSKFPFKVRQRTNDKAVSPKAPKKRKYFSESRDKREDRGIREVKTSHNAQTMPRGP